MENENVETRQNFGTVLNGMKKGWMVKKASINNDTLFVIYQRKLYMLNETTGQRYPWVPTDEDLMAEDYYYH